MATFTDKLKGLVELMFPTLVEYDGIKFLSSTFSAISYRDLRAAGVSKAEAQNIVNIAWVDKPIGNRTVTATAEMVRNHWAKCLKNEGFTVEVLPHEVYFDGGFMGVPVCLVKT